MFRISQYMRELAAAERDGCYPVVRDRRPRGPVVIWNLVRRCNLTCKHCYALSADHDYPDELSLPEVNAVMDDLRAFHVPVLILSGGEPLLRADLFDIAKRAKAMGFYTGLSTNGTLIDAPMADRVAAHDFDYVGISLDGMRETHDRFRRKQGAFDASLAALRLLRERGVKTGMRYTMTDMNGADLAPLLQLMQDERIDKFYFSHLNYAGRGNIHRGRDAHFAATREALDRLFDTAWAAARRECAGGEGAASPPAAPVDYVSGNNDADGVYLLLWVRRHLPRWADAVQARLEAWGGNASGLHVANIDNLGHVHPDTMWWHHDLGSVRERPFSQIWADTTDPLMAGLKRQPRPVKGRCGACAHLAICGGNTRVRADQVTGDPWAEDPGCYLDDAEIGLDGTPTATPRIVTTPFRQRPRVVSA